MSEVKTLKGTKYMKAKIIFPVQLVRVVVCGLGLLITTVASTDSSDSGPAAQR